MLSQFCAHDSTKGAGAGYDKAKGEVAITLCDCEGAVAIALCDCEGAGARVRLR